MPRQFTSRLLKNVRSDRDLRGRSPNLSERASAQQPAIPGRRALAWLALGLALSLGACKQAEPKPRHLLLVTIDTLRADAVGAYGKSPSPTPNLDRLAKEGTLFRRVQSHVPLTLPSHATLFTGKLPFENGVRNNGTYALPEKAQTLAETLSEQGFATGAGVASFVLARKFGLAQGFATYDDDLGDAGLLRALRAEVPASRVYEKWQHWLAAQPAEKSFFYWAHFYDPHQPYEPPAAERARFPGDPYAGEIAFVDEQLGRMIEDLRSKGLLEETLVVVTSDHGEGFGEHGEIGHGLLTYQESLEVPLVLRGPGIPTGREIATRVGLVDLMPSLLEAFGKAVPAGLSGHNFLPLLAGAAAGTATAEPTFYFESLLGQEDRNWAPITGLLVGDDKLIAVPHAELYNLADDPGEKENRLENERRRWRELDAKLQSLLLGKEAIDGSRTADAQDVATLRSLGYVSSGGAGGKVLDPKDGILLDARLQEIEKELGEGRIAEAEKDLDAARADFPGVEQPAFYLLERRLRESAGDLAGATAALRRGVARLPEVFPLRYELLRQLYDRHLFADAIAEARQMLERQPDSAQVLTVLGKSLEGAGDLKGAADAFAKAHAADPGNSEVEAEMAGVLTRSGRLPEALAIHERLIAAGAYEGKGRRLLEAAMLYAQAGRRARALELFDRGLALEPNGLFLLTSAMLLAQDGRVAEAAERMRLAIEKHPGDLTPEQQALARQALRAWGQR